MSIICSSYQFLNAAPRVLRGENKIHLKVMRIKKDIYAKSPLYRGVPLWDRLDEKTQKLATHNQFLNAIKKSP